MLSKEVKKKQRGRDRGREEWKEPSQPSLVPQAFDPSIPTSVSSKPTWSTYQVPGQVVAHALNSSTQETESGRYEFKATKDYKEKPCFK